MKPRVLLGMSGGVDSSVAAMILQEKGYDVTGISFRFFGNDTESEQQFNDARQLAGKLKINHSTIDLRQEFNQKIITYFINEYQAGRTPFPCAKCNPEMKFSALEKYAEINGCDFISTGHYAQIKQMNGISFIYKGVDPDKDQSFFLWGLNSALLQKLILPLGEFTKTQIRKIAVENGFLPLSEKKDSLGICFTEGTDYRDFLKSVGVISEPGNFVTPKGEILGQHLGITNYTIGQRRGLSINLNFPVFVAEIRPDVNEIVLAEYNNLYRTKVRINNVQFADIQEIKPDVIYDLKVHYRRGLTPCGLNIQEEGRAEVHLLKPEAMIANGQTAVFYDGARLVGGGFIEWSE
ncbi:MAG: tRNA 2-thiouridine(34) synthase MnmA [Draconibacterium sp.]|jgi:tRNA-specific 2-thiouridylase